MKNKSKYDTSKIRTLKNTFNFKEYENIVNNLLEKENYKEALPFLTEMNNHKEDLEYLLKTGLCYYNTSDYENSLLYFVKVYNACKNINFAKISDEMVSRLINFISFSYHRLEKHKECMAFCKTITPKSKGYITSLEQILYSHIRLLEHENVLKQLNYVLKLTPNNTNVYKMMFYYYLEIEKFEEACDFFDKSNEKEIDTDGLYGLITNIDNPDFYERKIKYCKIYLEKANHENKSLEYDEFGEILDELILTYFRLNNYEKVIEYYIVLKKHHESYLDEFNDDLNYQYLDYLAKYAVISFIKLKRYSDGLNIFLSLVKNDIWFEETYLLTAVLFYFKNDYENAINYCGKLTRTNEVLPDFIAGIIKNSIHTGWEKRKEFFMQLFEKYNKEKNELLIIIIYILLIINKIENNENEIENYTFLLKNYESNNNFTTIYNKLTEIPFDNDFYDSIILLSLEFFEF